MRKFWFLALIFVFASCTDRNKKNNMVESVKYFKSIEVSSSEDFFKVNKNNTFTDEEIIIFFDSLIPDNLDLLKNICYSKENENSSDNLKIFCSIYKVYLLLCDKDFESAKEQIEKLQAEEVVHYQFDKFVSFYFWCLKRYEAANWNADFYLFRLHKEKTRTIKRSDSKMKFEIRFSKDPSYKYLKKMLN